MQSSQNNSGDAQLRNSQPRLNHCPSVKPLQVRGGRAALRRSFPQSLALLILALVAGSLTLFFVLRLVFVVDAKAPDNLHVLSIPYYSTKGDWDSTLTLNNATHNPLAASLTLYSLDGMALPLPDLVLQPNLTSALRLSDLIARAEGRGRFQEGSIELRFNGAPMDLGAQLTVTDINHGLSFDMEPPMAFKSSTLEGLWWSLDDKTRGQVMLSNTTSQRLDLQLNAEWQGMVIPARPISLSARQTLVVDIEALLNDLHLNARGIESGGISITHSGMPGALVARGVIVNKEARFASNLSFIDPAAQKSAVLNGTGLMLAHPPAGAAFPATSFFRPNLALRNASTSSQTATVTVQYTAGGAPHSETLPAVNLAPHEVRMVDFSTLLGSLRDAAVEDAGIKIESSGAAGSLIAQLSSADQSRRMCVDVPLTADSPHFIGTGAHPFHLEGDYRAVVHLKNLDAQPTTAIIQVLYDGGEFSPELVRLGPGQAVGIDIRQLRDSRAKDVHGHQMPVNLNEGQVQWFQHGKQSVIGRLVVSSAALGVSANFACGGTCCPPSFSSAWVDPGSLDGIPEDIFSLTVWEMDYGCAGYYGPYNITSFSSCWSTDLAVAQVSGESIEMMDEGEATINVNHWASFFERLPTECESGPCEVNCNETDNLLTEAVAAIVRVPHHLKVVSDTGSVDNGCGAAERLIRFQVVDRNGLSVHPTRTKESFSPSTVLNSCRNNETITPSSCSTDTTGAFTDRVSVGCPFSGGSDCGFDVTSTWQWCPLRRAAVSLGTLQYRARRTSVLANGSGQFSEGQAIFP